MWRLETSGSREPQTRLSALGGPVAGSAPICAAMPAVWAAIPWNSPPWAQGLLWFVLWLGAGLAAAKLVGLLWRRGLLPLAGKAGRKLDVTLLKAICTPTQVIAFLATVKLGGDLSFAGLPQWTGHPAWRLWQGILFVGLVLSVTAAVYIAARAAVQWHAVRLAGEERTRKLGGEFVSLFPRLARLVLLFVAVTIILGRFGVQITGLLATAGVASIVVALAAQEALANVIAGLVLMADRPFKPGDRIQLSDGLIGDVQAVGLRSTEILSFDNTLVTVPNSQMARTQITNFNAPNAAVKLRCTLGVAYSTDVRRAKAVLLEAMAAHPKVLADPKPAAYFAEFGDSALKILFVCWTADYRDKFTILDELNMDIKDRFEAAGIEIPFPQRDVHLRLRTPPNPPGGDHAQVSETTGRP